jgi:hypothetical protein
MAQEAAERKGLTRQDYIDAIRSQEASNIGGLGRSFGAVMPRIQEDVRRRQAAGESLTVARHPVTVLFVTQLAFLAGVGTDGEAMHRYSEAHQACEAWARGEGGGDAGAV